MPSPAEPHTLARKKRRWEIDRAVRPIYGCAAVRGSNATRSSVSRRATRAHLRSAHGNKGASAICRRIGDTPLLAGGMEIRLCCRHALLRLPFPWVSPLLNHHHHHCHGTWLCGGSAAALARPSSHNRLANKLASPIFSHGRYAFVVGPSAWIRPSDDAHACRPKGGG